MTVSVSSTKNQVNAYSAASNGALTPIPGSPFHYNVDSLALNGAWLFAVDRNNQNRNTIDSFAIASNGSISLKDHYTTDVSGGAAFNLFLDHTGSTLYGDYYTINNDYQAQGIDQATGQLSFIQDLQGGIDNGNVMSFIGNNEYAYSSSCVKFGPDIFGVHRRSDGVLTWLNINPRYPPERHGGFYCPYLAAADPTNHLAVAMAPMTCCWSPDGNWQLAVYTADSSGNLTTTSTWENMPSILVGAAQDYWMSPDGKYLAVAGTSGLQIFKFNGSNPITKLTDSIATGVFAQVFWDNLDHLYAVGFNKLYVFTVTSTGAKPAPGSPHSVTGAGSLIVLPK